MHRLLHSFNLSHYKDLALRFPGFPTICTTESQIQELSRRSCQLKKWMKRLISYLICINNISIDETNFNKNWNKKESFTWFLWTFVFHLIHVFVVIHSNFRSSKLCFNFNVFNLSSFTCISTQILQK